MDSNLVDDPEGREPGETPEKVKVVLYGPRGENGPAWEIAPIEVDLLPGIQYRVEFPNGTSTRFYDLSFALDWARKEG